MFDVTTGQPTQVAQHEAPISVVGWVEAPGSGILATGSWDKTIKVRIVVQASSSLCLQVMLILVTMS